MGRHLPRIVMSTLAVPVAVACTLAAAAVTPTIAGATSGSTRYASPGGSSTASCTKSHSCELSKAVNGASSGDTVIVEPGNYTTAMTSPTLAASGITMEGEAGSAMPVINSSAQVALSLTGGSLSHVKVVATGHIAISSTGPVDHVVALVSGSGGAACEVTTSISDSVCADSGAQGVGVYLYYVPSTTVTNRLHPTVFNVTSEATAATGIGLHLFAQAKNIVTVRVTNSILHGKKVDAEAETDAVTAAATVVLKHTDYKTSAHKGSNGAAAVDGDSTDIHKAPVFVDGAHDKFAEKASSPTIDLGIGTPDGDTDVAGHPRWVGRAPDLGAYEFREPPEVAKLMATHTSAHKATLVAQVNPEGLKTTVQVVATLGKKTVKSNVVNAGHGRSVETVHLHIKGLHAQSLYKMRAIATSTGGSAHTQKKSLRTGA